MVAIAAFIDWRVTTNISFGFLYLFPMLVAGSCMSRLQVVAVAALCTLLTEWFDPFTLELAARVPIVILIFAGFSATGLFAYESAKNRNFALQHVQEIESEVELRREAEQQLKTLIESSPAAIVTLDASGKALMANSAAHRLLGFDPDGLVGTSIHSFLPCLAKVPSTDESMPSFRTSIQCRGRRRSGEMFLADIWFSTFKTKGGVRLAAMVLDISEDLRNREELSLHQLLTGSRLVVGAVTHEIRNICGAISVVYTNLSRKAAIAQNEDFQALGTLVEGLERIAALELKQTAGGNKLSAVNLHQVMEELRIVSEPELQESGISVRWKLAEGLPRVWAEPHALLQVLLNLVKNSERAMQNSEAKELSVSASLEGERVVLRVRDTGSGVANPERLFRPFQPGAEATGLGLYLSRAFARAFEAELRYEAGHTGCCFALDLMPCAHVDAFRQ
jgi:PAS domain S-box-containing protein